MNLRKIRKLIRCLQVKLYRESLRYGVAAAIEHECLLALHEYVTIIDIGANRGQFALVARQSFPAAKIHSFEPLVNPGDICRQVFLDDGRFALHRAAIGPKEMKAKMHISAKDDSSSLLPIGTLQEVTYPGTCEIGTVEVDVAPLSAYIDCEEIERPSMLKIDVQGFELEVLFGSEELLGYFDSIYCECSFVELYRGQKLAAEIVAWLSAKEFRLAGIYNVSYDKIGRAVQADFMFHAR